MSIADNIRALMTLKGLTQEDIAKASGVSHGAVSKWLHGGQIRKMNLKALCDAYNLVPDGILSDDKGYAHRGIFERHPYVVPTHGKHAYVPMRSIGRVHAGKPTDPLETSVMVEVPATVAENHPAAFVLAVDGDCMNRVIPEGAHILVDPTCEPLNGSIAVVSLPDGNTYLRRWNRGQNTLLLTADSYEPHDDIVLHPDDGAVSVLGVVVWYQSPREMS